MIDSFSLMRGNIVHCKYQTVDVVSRIVSFWNTHDEEGVIILVNGQETGYSYKCTHGVPVTKERVLAAGFVLVPDTIDEYKRGLITISLKYNDDETKEYAGFVYLRKPDGTKHGVIMLYMHQVQNLYYILTGHQLIINE